MANKKFGELKGVILKLRGDDTRTYRHCYDVNDINNYDIASIGDVIFEIDLENNTINRCNVKYIYKHRDGMISITYCDMRYNRDFKPTSNTFYGENLPQHMKRVSCMYNKSSYGLISTNMAEAVERLTRLKEGKYFGALTDGNRIYLVDKKKEIVREEIVRLVSRNDAWHHDNKHFNIETDNYCISCYNSEFEDNVSTFSDKDFHISGANCPHYDKCSVHIDKSEAEKALRAYLNNKENAKKKKAEKPKIPIGTPIRHKDNNGNELHHGDLVAYVRKDWGGHTDISYAVIIGDSDKKIKVFDKTEAEEKWKRSRYHEDPNNGIHILENSNVLLIKLAK